MARRLSPDEVLMECFGTTNLEDLTAELMSASVPACCSELCEVEPDGECEHGFPSVLIALGVM